MALACHDYEMTVIIAKVTLQSLSAARTNRLNGTTIVVPYDAPILIGITPLSGFYFSISSRYESRPTVMVLSFIVLVQPNPRATFTQYEKRLKFFH